jgi:hypothetical protein
MVNYILFKWRYDPCFYHSLKGHEMLTATNILYGEMD